jgi:TetR/AcrR family transcriptional repressor of nem operon
MVVHIVDMNDVTIPGRPRSFDEDAVLQQVMEAFWSSGYTATSYPALERATGLRRQSLIYAYGDKPTMFARALAFYVRRRVGEIVGVLDGTGAPLDRVARVFDHWIADAGDEVRRGCLLVNTAGELGHADPEAARTIAAATDRLARAFERCFRAAQEDGTLRAGLDPADLARLAVAAGDGALLHARAGGSSDDAVRAYTAFLALLR